MPNKHMTDPLASRSVPTASRDLPLAIGPLVQLELPRPTVELAGLLNSQQRLKIPQGQLLRPSLCLHIMKLRGVNTQVDVTVGQESQTVSLRDVLLDAEISSRHVGQPSFVPTRTGVRFPTERQGKAGAGDEAHRDQCLAMLAELGFALSERLESDRGAATLRDVLRDSIANFHLDQDELAWTTVAYALYLPPQSSWQNRYGSVYTFDDLASELMERPLREASCGGTHRFYALTILARADQQLPVFSEAVRRQVWSYLQRVVEGVVRHQQPDGSWNPNWYQALEAPSRPIGYSPTGGLQAQVLITGHLAEWLLYLPPQLMVSPDVLRRSGFWLAARLDESSSEQFWGSFCPYTHAVCALVDACE